MKWNECENFSEISTITAFERKKNERKSNLKKYDLFAIVNRFT